MQQPSFDELPFFHDYEQLWKEMNKRTDEEAISQKYEETSKILGQYAALNNQFISIFNTKSQRVLYMSENYLDVLGYTCTEEEYKRYSTLYWMRDLPFSQSWFFMQMTLFFKNTVQPLLKEANDGKSLSWYMHNFLLSPPKTQKRHISLTGSALELTQDGSMIVMMLIIKEVSPLIKEDGTWWAEFFINGDTVYNFHQNEKKFTKGSILSSREREILLLIKNGFDTKQISDKLSISPHTVDQHRKNMIERTGTKNSTSLIQICELGKII